MSDDGDTKDDVKMPDGEIGEKIEKLFKAEEKDTSEFTSSENIDGFAAPLTHFPQTSLFSLPWVRRPLLRPRRPPASKKLTASASFLLLPPVVFVPVASLLVG